MKPSPTTPDIESRDGNLLILLGGFLAVLAMMVMAGMLFENEPIDLWINFAAGALLLVVGLAFVLAGRRSRGARKEESEKGPGSV